MMPIARSAALAAGLLLACLALPGCETSADEAYVSERPWRGPVPERVEQDVRAMLEGMLRAHYGQYGSWER